MQDEKLDQTADLIKKNKVRLDYQIAPINNSEIKLNTTTIAITSEGRPAYYIIIVPLHLTLLI